MPGGDVRLSGCRAGRGGPYGNPGSPGSWRWAQRPLPHCRGRGGCVFLNPWGGTCASRLWGWHLGREEAGAPRAGSVGWDVPMPVPMPVPSRAGRERKSLGGGPVPGAGHASGFAGCRGVGGGAGQAPGAALALSPGWGVGGGGGCGGTLGMCLAPWALSRQGRGGQESWWGCATLGTLCHPRKPCSTLGNPMPSWGPSAIPGPSASLGTLCHPGDPVPKMSGG